MGHSKKGYKDLTKSKVYLCDFRRPHRKELMSSIFRKTTTTDPNIQTDNPGFDVIGIKGEKRHDNPLAAVINQKLAHGSGPYVLRPLIKLPPRYKAKLSELEGLRVKLEAKLSVEEVTEQEFRRAKLKLTFDEDLKRDFSGKRIPSKEVEYPIEVDQDDDADKVGTLSSDFGKEKRQEELNAALESEKKSAKSRQSQNVQYMLQIWGKSEGAQLGKLPNNSKGKARKKNIETNHSVPPSLSIQETENLDASKVKNTPPPSRSDLYDKTNRISEYTLEFLKRMSRDSANDPIQDAEIEHAQVHKTLTGVEPNAHRQDFLKSIELEENLHSNSKVKYESPFKSITPGTGHKIIGNLISDEGDLLFDRHFNQTECKDWNTFQLFIPPLASENESISRHQEKEVAVSNTTFKIDKGFTKTMITERLKTLFGRNIIIPSYTATSLSTFKPAMLKDKTAPTETNSDSLVVKRFSLLLKSFLQPESKNIFSDDEKRVLRGYLTCESCQASRLPLLGTNDGEILIKCLVMCLRREQLCYESIKFMILLQADGLLGRWDSMIFKQGLKDIMDFGTDEQKQVVALYNMKNSQISEKDIHQIRQGLGDLNDQKREMAIEILQTMPFEFASQIVDIIIQDAVHSNWRIRLDVIGLLEKWIPRLAPPEPGPPKPQDKDALDTDDEQTIKALFHTLGSAGNANPDPNLIFSDMEFNCSLDLSSNLDAIFLESKSSEKEIIPAIVEAEVKVVPKIVSNEKTLALYYQCVDSLLKLMTNEWNVDVRIAASEAVGMLNLGNAFFDWIVRSLECSDPVIRIDGLRCLACIGAIHGDSLKAFLKSFKDPYASVKIEACKVALSLGCNDRFIMAALMDLLDDHDYKVRAYAVKAMGYSKSRSAKVSECLNWALMYDSNPIVRIEALQAVHQLGVLQEDMALRNSALTLLTADPSKKVQQEAEKILILAGILYPNIDSGDTGKRDQRVTVDGQIVSPYPHLLQNHAQEEIDIYLRESLVGADEVNSVIDKVGKLSNKAAVMAEVNESGFHSMGMRLDIDMITSTKTFRKGKGIK